MPFSNSKVSVPKIAQHCCPFSIPRLLSHCMNARAWRLFFLLYKSEKPEVTISNKKPLELPSHYQMKDNEIEDEKSVDVLPFKQLESQKTVLPQDIFRNELTWECSEMSKSLAFRIWMLLWLPLSV